LRTDGSRLETNCIFQTFIYKNILVCKVYCQNKGSIRMALEQASMYSDNSWGSKIQPSYWTIWVNYFSLHKSFNTFHFTSCV